jgi:hypothetical protein
MQADATPISFRSISGDSTMAKHINPIWFGLAEIPSDPGFTKTVSHVNRTGNRYYLNVGTTKTGKPRYWFSTKTDGTLVESIPDGYEIYESPECQVFLRKTKPQLVRPEEVDIVRSGLARYAPDQNCIIDVRDEHIVVYHSQRLNLDPLLREFAFQFRALPVIHSRPDKVMRFTLEDRVKRGFRVQRWCYRGSVDDWIDLMMTGRQTDLSELVNKFCPHIGQESFFELI